MKLLIKGRNDIHELLAGVYFLIGPSRGKALRVVVGALVIL
ncbi:MAG: hypothetical protein ACUVUD_00535 [bacterium]